MTALVRTLARPRVIPGFGITLGYTLTYLGIIVLLPLAAVVARSAGMGWHDFIAIISAPRTIHALWLSFGAAFIATLRLANGCGGHCAGGDLWRQWHFGAVF